MKRIARPNVTLGRLVAVAITGVLAVASAPAAEPANWKEQDLVLDYMGFTTRYSCDGLRDRVRAVLLQLGARPDLSITSAGCMRQAGGPERFPSVRVHFATLQPATEPTPAAGAWKSVELGGVNGLDGGECELADAVVRDVLPHFAVRNVRWHNTCVPHSASIALSLHLDVFAPTVPAR